MPGDYRPETLIYENLKQTDEKHEFWNKCKVSTSGSYNKQFAVIKVESPPTESQKAKQSKGSKLQTVADKESF